MEMTQMEWMNSEQYLRDKETYLNEVEDDIGSVLTKLYEFGVPRELLSSLIEKIHEEKEYSWSNGWEDGYEFRDKKIFNSEVKV